MDDTLPLLGNFPGMPDGCSYCKECDLSGDLYLNSELGNASATISSDLIFAPPASAVCRRYDETLLTTTTEVTTRVFSTTTLVPPTYIRMGVRCELPFMPITDSRECEGAASWLEMFDTTVSFVDLPQNNSISNNTFADVSMDGKNPAWPPGCFSCLMCDAGELYFNGLDDWKEEEQPTGSTTPQPNTSGTKPNTSNETNASMFSPSPGPNTSNETLEVNTNFRRVSSMGIGTASFVIETLCKAPADMLTTTPPQMLDNASTTTKAIGGDGEDDVDADGDEEGDDDDVGRW